MQKYVCGNKGLETTHLSIGRGLGKFWDIHTMEYSAAVEMKEVNLSVRIYNKLHNILLSFTKEQRSMCKKGRGTYACICIENFWKDTQEI